MKFSVRRLGAAMLAASLGLPMAANATNGIFMIGIGAKSESMGGVGIAYAADSLASAMNPALLPEIPGNSRIDVSMMILHPSVRAETNTTDPANIKGDKSAVEWFPIPAMGGHYKFNRKLYVGGTFAGVGGGGAKYRSSKNPLDETGINSRLAINLAIAQFSPTVAYKYKKNHTFGASVILSAQAFRAEGLDDFTRFTVSPAATDLTGKGWDTAYGIGVRVGWLGKFLKKKLNIGAVVTSKVYMTEFTKYSELFANKGLLETPPNAGLGFAYKVNPKLTVAGEVVKVFYESVPAISNAGPNTPDATEPFPVSKEVNGLGQDQGLGFGWHDQVIWKIGVNYDHSKEWTFRAGYNYGRSPIDEEEDILFNTVAPATTEDHYTFGASYRPMKRHEFSATFGYAPRVEQFGPTFIFPNGKISMEQHWLSFAYGYEMF